jgi:hypothetical protein
MWVYLNFDLSPKHHINYYQIWLIIAMIAEGRENPADSRRKLIAES